MTTEAAAEKLPWWTSTAGAPLASIELLTWSSPAPRGQPRQEQKCAQATALRDTPQKPGTIGNQPLLTHTLHWWSPSPEQTTR